MTYKTIPERVAALEADVAILKDQIKSKVSNDAFTPVAKIAYGAASLILALFLTGAFYLVIKK